MLHSGKQVQGSSGNNSRSVPIYSLLTFGRIEHQYQYCIEIRGEKNVPIIIDLLQFNKCNDKDTRLYLQNQEIEKQSFSFLVHFR